MMLWDRRWACVMTINEELSIKQQTKIWTIIVMMINFMLKRQIYFACLFLKLLEFFHVLVKSLTKPSPTVKPLESVEIMMFCNLRWTCVIQSMRRGRWSLWLVRSTVRRFWSFYRQATNLEVVYGEIRLYIRIRRREFSIVNDNRHVAATARPAPSWSAT